MSSLLFLSSCVTLLLSQYIYVKVNNIKIIYFYLFQQLVQRFQNMDKKYRIKRLKNVDDPENNDSKMSSPIKTRANKQTKDDHEDQKRFRSQIIKPVYNSSPDRKTKLSRNFDRSNRKTFSKLNKLTPPLNFSEFETQTRERSITVPQSHNINHSLQLRKTLTPRQQNTSQINEKSEMKKFPYYVSKSFQMVETKQKLLEIKHNIKMDNFCPILQSIEDSINEDKTGFNRKMKLQLYKKGNQNLIGFLNKDINDSLQKQNNSKSKSKSKEKQYKVRNLPNLMAMQYKDPYMLEKIERVQKMQEIKRKLKVVRKNNLSRCYK